MLRVGSPQPEFNNEPIDYSREQSQSGIRPDEMNNQDSMNIPDNNNGIFDDGDSGNDDNQFDSNFDAGIDTDEKNDPRKYIQQLTGKLSQTLRSYNQEQEHPDVDLCKYVAGMINKQAIEGLSPDDVEDILKKVKSDDNSDDFESQEDGDDSYNQQVPEEPNDNIQREGVDGRNIIDELFQDITSSDETDNDVTKPIRRNSYKQRPYVSPKF